MARDLYIFGETLVSVEGKAPAINSDTSDPNNSGPGELGLAADMVRIMPQWNYKDLRADDFGPAVPPETLWMGGICFIGMTLVDFDKDILELCEQAAMGITDGSQDGSMAEFGIPLGATSSFIKLTLGSDLQDPYIFPYCHLMGPPYQRPLGVERSLVTLQWRSLPFMPPSQGGEVSSTGTNIWQRS